MGLQRVLRGVVALVGGCLPVAVLWLLIVGALDQRQDAARLARTVVAPNPKPAPAHFLGPVDVLAVDPYLAGSINVWLFPGVVLLGGLVLWAMGVPVLTLEAPPGWPVPSLRRVVLGSLGLGLVLAGPWIYAWIRILLQPSPWPYLIP
jgi:hypothetical protein